MMVKNFLVVGASSFVGSYLVKQESSWEWVGTFYKNKISNGIQIDLSNPVLRIRDLDFEKFDGCLILSGETNPDICFKDKLGTFKINVLGTKILLDEFIKRDKHVIFTSSEFIFDGVYGSYDESDEPSPILEYGRHKLEVEKYLNDSGFEKFTILRLGKVYGTGIKDKTIMQSFLHDLSGLGPLKVAFDQIFSPIHVNDVCSAISESIKSKVYGTYNCGGDFSGSRFYLYKTFQKILESKGIDTPSLEPCSICDFNLPEKRPKDVSMISYRLKSDLLKNQYNILDQMEKYIYEIKL